MSTSHSRILKMTHTSASSRTVTVCNTKPFAVRRPRRTKVGTGTRTAMQVVVENGTAATCPYIGFIRQTPIRWYSIEVLARVVEDFAEGGNEGAFRGRVKIEAWDECRKRRHRSSRAPWILGGVDR